MSLEQDTKNIPSLLKSTRKDGGKLPRFTFKDLGKFGGEKDWDYQLSLFLHPTTESNKKNSDLSALNKPLTTLAIPNAVNAPSRLSAAEISTLPGDYFYGYQLLATDNAGTVVWKDLTNTQIRDLRTGSIFFGVVIDGVISGGPLTDPSNRYLRNMTTAQILELDGSLIGAMNADQLNTIDHNNHPIWQEFILSPSHANYLPSSFTWPNLTGTQVTSLFTNLVEGHTVASLSPSIFAALSSTALVNGILGMLLANAKAFITGMTNSQLAQLTPNVINGLLTSSSTVAAIFLNIGATGSLNANQLQALIGGSADLSLINARVLGSTLSVSALQGLDTTQIGRLTADQLWQILANPSLSKVIYGAGSGDGYWTLQQLQAISVATIAQMTQDQYLQFTGGLSVFSQAQQDAMSVNVALLEIMITGQTNVWTQDQVNWIVQNIPGMIPQSGLLGGGIGYFKGGNNQQVRYIYQIPGDNFSTMTVAQIPVAISSVIWGALSPQARTALLSNPALPEVLGGLSEDQLLDIMGNVNLIAQLNAVNFAALAKPMTEFFDLMPSTTLSELNQVQVDILLTLSGDTALTAEERVDTFFALGRIAQEAPTMLAGRALSQEQVNALIILAKDDLLTAEERGVALLSLGRIVQSAPAMLASLSLSQGQVNILVALASKTALTREESSNAVFALGLIAQEVPSMLTTLALSQTQINTLFEFIGNATLPPDERIFPLFALGRIAQNAPYMLTGHSLLQEQLNILVGLAGNTALTAGERVIALFALGRIAEGAPAMLAGCSLNQEQVNVLVGLAEDNTLETTAMDDAFLALGRIAKNTPAMFAGCALTEVQVNTLIADAGDTTATIEERGVALQTLGLIVEEVATLLAGRTLSQEQVNTLVALSGDATLTVVERARALLVLGLFAQEVPILFANCTLSQEQVNVLVSLASNVALTMDERGNALFTLARIAQYTPHMLARRVLSQEQVNALVLLAGDTTFTAEDRVIAFFALGQIAQNKPSMLAGCILSQEQINFLVVTAGDTTLTAEARAIALFTLGRITQNTPDMLSGLRITNNFFALLDSSEELGLGLSNLAQMNLIGGFDPDVLTDTRLNNISTTGPLEGIVATLIANGHQDWVNESLHTIVDLNLRTNYQVPGGISEINTAAQAGNFDALYDAILAAQGGVLYQLSAAAFEAYAVTEQGGRYLNWLVEHHPTVIQSTLTAMIQQTGHGYTGGLSGAGFSSTFLTVAGNNFWNHLSDNNSDVVRYMQNNWANVFSNWSTNAIQSLGENATTQGQVGFIGLISGNANARGLLGGALARSINSNPGIFNIYAERAIAFLNALSTNLIDVTNGSPLPYANLTTNGLINLIQNGHDVLVEASATQVAAIPLNLLSGLVSEQANLLTENFWQNITTEQLTAIFNNPDLGSSFFGSANTPNHISAANLQAINSDALAQSVAAVPAIQATIIGDWEQLSLAQQNAILNQAIPGFMPSQVNGGFAGNSSVINQQIIGNMSLLVGQKNAGGNTALESLTWPALAEVQDLVSADYQGEVLTGATWVKGSTVSVSVVGFSDIQTAQLSDVLDKYATITGLSFKMVPADGQINLKFSDLEAATGSVGLTTIVAANGRMRSAQTLLERPTEDVLSGISMYPGTQTSFVQLIGHEIGHALGLADNNLTGSLENYYLGVNNQTLSAVDIATLKDLYSTSSRLNPNTDPNIHPSPNPSATPITVLGLHQLVQAMVTSHAPERAVTTSTGVFTSTPSINNPLTLSSNTMH